VGGNQLETANENEARKASLGESLVAARERRGLSRETVVQQTHIPANYLQMLEDDDYRRISDRLYLLPFLRKYASFLDIDQDETAMRLLHEVQRVDNSPLPVRLDEPLDDMRRYRRRNWSKGILFSGLIAVIIGSYIVQSRHSETDTIAAPKRQSSQAAVVSPPSLASKETTSSIPTAQSASAFSAAVVDSSTPQQKTLGTKTSTRPGSQSVNQAMTGPNEPSNPPQRKTPDARQMPKR
jgi:cytoskeletal protein RodZ